MSDGKDDTDGDGLRDLFEYLAGTDPMVVSTFGGLLTDAEIDSDSDGLENKEEQDVFPSNPGSVDTDDDGVNDNVEARELTSPWQSDECLECSDETCTI